MSEIRIFAERPIEVIEFYAIVEIHKKTYREDMANVLKVLLDLSIEEEYSYDELESISRYFYHLGLITSKKTLTRDGNRLLHEKIMFEKERGLYKLYCLKDPIIFDLLGYEPIAPYDTKKDIEELGTLTDLDVDIFNKCENREFKSKIGDEISYFVKFIRQEDSPPPIVIENIYQFTLKLQNKDEDIFEITSSIEIGNTIKEITKEIQGDVLYNVERWMGSTDFSREEKALEISYMDIKDTDFEKENFELRKNIISNIDFDYEDDDNDWNIFISVPLKPRTHNDAVKWVNDLLLKKLIALYNETSVYISKSNIEDVWYDIIEQGQLQEYFYEGSDIYINKFIETTLKRFPDIYWRVIAYMDVFEKLVDAVII